MNIVTMVIKSRHSVRKFKPDPIDDTVIRDVIECASHAPTAKNLQPWLFGVIQDKETLRNIAQLTDNGKFIADSSFCIAVFGEKKSTYYLEDCCAATENLIIALQAYGIGSCWVAGDKKPYAEEVQKLLNVPDTYSLISLVPAGLPAEISMVKKKDLKSVLFEESYKRDSS